MGVPVSDRWPGLETVAAGRLLLPFVFLTLLGRRPDVVGHDPMIEYQTQRLEYLSE
jgi:hypothetical protein